MLTVKTKIAPSKIAGIGLFADEPIHKGTLVWKYEPLIDLLLPKEEIDKLSPPSQQQFYNYAYLDKNIINICFAATMEDSSIIP